MKETIQMDGAGRVVLPKDLRERFHLAGGDTLAIEVKGDAIELRPTKTKVRLEKVNGVLVLAGGPALPENQDYVQKSREERIGEIAREIKGRR